MLFSGEYNFSIKKTNEKEDLSVIYNNLTILNFNLHFVLSNSGYTLYIFLKKKVKRAGIFEEK